MATQTLGYAMALPVQEEISGVDHVRLAKLGEDEGFSTVFVGEIGGPEAFSLAGAVAASTSTIRIATGVVSVFLRSPSLMAMGFRTLASLAPGRIVAGVGVGSATIVNDWHGLDFSESARTLEESVDALRIAVSGQRLSFTGAHHGADQFRVTLPDTPDVPVWTGALSSRGRRIGGRHADGVLMAFCRVERAERNVAEIREAAAAAGRQPGDVEIGAYVNCYTGSEPDAARERMRRLVTQYAVHPTHMHAFEDVFPEVRNAAAAWTAGDRGAALAMVPDVAIDALTPVGTPSEIADRLARLKHLGIDLPVLYPHPPRFGDAASVENTIRSVAAELRKRL